MKTKETYFFENIGIRTANAGCEGENYSHNGVSYDNSVEMIEMQVSISKETGKYNPEDGRLAVSNKIILIPHEMDQTRKTRLVYETVNLGTFLISMDDLPESECQVIEEVFTGNTSVFEPHGDTEEARKEPTTLIVQDDESNREISLSFLGPETICKRSMRSTNQPNIFIRFLEEHKEPISDEIR